MKVDSMASTKEPIICPSCHGANPPDAVFCDDSTCGKALGEFRFVQEELAATLRWHEQVADRVSSFVGQSHFLVVHAVWFTLWILLNTGIVATLFVFDEYPFSLLGFVMSIESIFITGFLLISANRARTHINKLAQLDYEVNVRTYRKLGELENILHELMGRLDQLDRTGATRELRRSGPV